MEKIQSELTKLCSKSTDEQLKDFLKITQKILNKDKKINSEFSKICKLQEEKTWICKSTAKNKYHLTDNDLENLTYREVKNPHYRCAAPMMLYEENDVIDYTCKKFTCSFNELHNRIAILDAVKKEKEKNLKQKRNIKQKERRDMLISALDKVGLKIRSDSRLCSGYINGTIKDWTLEDIVERMCQMKYLFDYCDMSTYLSSTIHETREYRGYYDKEEVFEMAEHEALQKHGGYPKKYPWINK